LGGSEDGGLKYLDRIAQQLKEIDFGQKSKNGTDLTPELTSDLFLELVSKNEGSSLMTFSALIGSRESRKLMDIIPAKEVVYLMRINTVFNDIKVGKNKINKDQLFRAFNAITKLNNFYKNNAPVGKGELALALTFSDCKLADEAGDIQSGKSSIEVKSSGGVITSRFIPQNCGEAEQLLMKRGDNGKAYPKTYQQLMQFLPEGSKKTEEIERIISKYIGMDERTMPKPMSKTSRNKIEDDEMNVNLDNDLESMNRERAVIFVYLFAKYYIDYYVKDNHQKIIMVDSGDSGRMAILSQIKGDKYIAGKRLLDSCQANGISVSVGARTGAGTGGECGFKAGFYSEKIK